jgi:hypothetical protein
LRPTPFIADVLLYDRLVIPYPPQADRAEWVRQGWNPARLDACLEALQDLKLLVPWDKPRRALWKERYQAASSVGFDTRNLSEAAARKVDPMYVTRVLLASEIINTLPPGVSRVWSLAAYPSASAGQQDLSQAALKGRRERLALALKQRFLVPRSANLPFHRALAQAVQLATREDFLAKRAKLNAWQESIIEEDIPESAAIVEMDRLLADYNAIIRKAAKGVYWRFAYTVIPIGLGVLGAGLLTPFAAIGALVSLHRFVKWDKAPKIDAGDCASAALIHDVRQARWVETAS